MNAFFSLLSWPPRMWSACPGMSPWKRSILCLWQHWQPCDKEGKTNNMLHDRKHYFQKSVEKRWYCTADTDSVLCKHTTHLFPQHPIASFRHHVEYRGKIMNSRNAKVTFSCLMDHFAQQGCVTAWKKKRTLLWSASQCFQSLCYLTVRGYTELGGYFRVHSQISGPQGSLVFLWYVWGTTLKNLFKIKACRSNTLHPQEKEHSRTDLHHSLSPTPAGPEKQLSAWCNQFHRYSPAVCPAKVVVEDHKVAPWGLAPALSVPMVINQQPYGSQSRTTEALSSLNPECTTGSGPELGCP